MTTVTNAEDESLTLMLMMKSGGNLRFLITSICSCIVMHSSDKNGKQQRTYPVVSHTAWTELDLLVCCQSAVQQMLFVVLLKTVSQKVP